jgi:hypothetical protein
MLHVIRHTVNPHLLSLMSSYDVVCVMHSTWLRGDGLSRAGANVLMMTMSNDLAIGRTRGARGAWGPAPLTPDFMLTSIAADTAYAY